MSAPLRITFEKTPCPRCGERGGKHSDLDFKLVPTPKDQFNFVCACPVTGEAILCHALFDEGCLPVPMSFK